MAVGLAGFIALLAAAAFWSIPGMENDLTDRANTELAAFGIDDIAVEFDGRNGHVTGVRAEEARDQLSSLRGARWVRAELVSAAPTTTTTTPPPAALASLQITRRGARVGLEGTVETSAQQQSIVAEVEAAGFEADDELVVDAEIDGSHVEATVGLLRPVLDGSEDGELMLSDGVATTTGTAADPVETEEIDAAVVEAKAKGLLVNNEMTTRVLSEDQQITALQDEINQIFELARAIEGQNPNFDVSDGELSTAAADILDRVVVAMRRYPLPAADIVGHTDSVGSTTANQELSESRANSVQDYLTEAGVVADRLTATGEGESVPVADNDTDEGRAQNRRVDFVVRKREG